MCAQWCLTLCDSIEILKNLENLVKVLSSKIHLIPQVLNEKLRATQEWWGLWKRELVAYTKHQLANSGCLGKVAGPELSELSIFQKKLKTQVLMCFLSLFLKHCADQTRPVCFFAVFLLESFV